MSTRGADPDEALLVVAVHESGHLIVAHMSTYFGLRDPAVEIDWGRDGYSALSGITKVRDTKAPEHHLPSTRDFIRIGLAGKAAEEEFLRRQPLHNTRLIPNPDGANDDLETVRRTLEAAGITPEREQLWQDTVAIVQQNWLSIVKVAELILTSDTNAIGRAEILALLPSKP